MGERLREEIEKQQQKSIKGKARAISHDDRDANGLEEVVLAAWSTVSERIKAAANKLFKITSPVGFINVSCFRKLNT